ncbi:hypothetical protein ACRAWF_31355 [Streptomyces sp. L7]
MTRRTRLSAELGGRLRVRRVHRAPAAGGGRAVLPGRPGVVRDRGVGGGLGAFVMPTAFLLPAGLRRLPGFRRVL